MSHPQDIVLVRNIHTDCDYFDDEEGYSHADAFMVRWDKTPFRIEVGQLRRFPRYLAEHYAKHLIDHILQKQEDEGKGKMMTRNLKLREKLHAEIFAEVEETYASDNRSAAEVEAQKIEALNKDFLAKTQQAYRGSPMPEGSRPAGPDDAVVEEDVEDEVDMPPAPVDYSTWSRPDLIREAKERGIKISATDKNVDLIAKLKDVDPEEPNTYRVTDIEEA